MAKGLIQHIAEELKSYQTDVLLIENNDRFLYRDDVINELMILGIEIVHGPMIHQRIAYELRERNTILVLLTQESAAYLEDIRKQSRAGEFFLKKHLSSWHIPSIIDLEIDLLERIYQTHQTISLDRKTTLQEVSRLQNISELQTTPYFQLSEFLEELHGELQPPTNWKIVCRIISRGILDSIGTKSLEELLFHVSKANVFFQQELKATYQQTKTSSAVKKPQIVSRILDYLDFNYREEKVALIVVDGMAYWQYELLKDKLPILRKEEVIYSWIPSITQLSRQAIFKGGAPVIDYKQGPVNEEKLWKRFWKDKGLQEFEIRYGHENQNLEGLKHITKYALVFKDLDNKMHSSTDYNDLLRLTENWVERSKIQNLVQVLHDAGFNIFITSDHGNIQARGWRGLRGREKLGTNVSGSRSERHIEYSEQWLAEEFIQENPDLSYSIVRDDQAIFFKDDLSFSRKDCLVTHGGAHLLEVLIPFIEIKA